MRLVSDLDVSVPPDTGFMVAFDNVSTTRMKWWLKFEFGAWLQICVLIPQLSLSFSICLSFWLLFISLQPGRNVKVGMCVYGRVLSHRLQAYPFWPTPLRVSSTTFEHSPLLIWPQILSQPRHYSIALLWSALFTAVPFRASINRVLVVTVRASLSPAELCRRVISRPFQAAQSYYSKREMGMP
jgi:hypothetical protein